MSVLAIWRYPIKAMLGEFIESVEVGLGGLAGDRRWIVAEVATGRRIANQRGPTDDRAAGISDPSAGRSAWATPLR